MNALNWTVETYRLDEIESKFGLPCVILVNEGYYSTTDAEGFSQGDIISVDSKVVLHKVAANFAKDIKQKPATNSDPEYVELASSKEILIPLKYKGRLKVIQKQKKYENIRELAKDFPRYARLRQNFSVLTEDNKKVTLNAGTVIELDRIIPGGYNSSSDRLIIQFEHLQRKATVALPVHLNGKFITEQDDNEYTLKDAIDRYSLPQDVRFVSDEIKRVYTSDLHDGISNVKSITDTYRLNRLVTQEVLVGHYKPINDVANHSDNVKQRTLILLPTDNPEIKDIEVNVAKDIDQDAYEDISLLRNVTKRNEEVMDGALYVDFADCPGIRRISTMVNADAVNYSPPLPLQPPPARHHVTVNRSKTLAITKNLYSTSATQDNLKPKVNMASLPRAKPRSASARDIRHPPERDRQLHPCLSEMSLSFDDDDYVRMNTPPIYVELTHGECSTSPTYLNTNRDEAVAGSPTNNTMGKNGLFQVSTPPDKKFKSPKEGRKLLEREISTSSLKQDYQNESPGYIKPTALVQPQSVYAEPYCGNKLFHDLSTVELAERLQLGGLYELAETCLKEKLNGAFFNNINKDRLKKVMGLKNLQLTKFLQMRDENWIPT